MAVCSTVFEIKVENANFSYPLYFTCTVPCNCILCNHQKHIVHLSYSTQPNRSKTAKSRPNPTRGSTQPTDNSDVKHFIGSANTVRGFALSTARLGSDGMVLSQPSFKPPPRYAIAMSFCLFVRLSVPETLIGLAARVSQVFPPCPREKLQSLREIYASGGGLLVAPINAPYLLATL